MKIANRGFYQRYKNFSGSFIEWFNTCADENDVFRFWFKDDPDAEADYVKISSVVDIGRDFLLGLKYVDWNGDEEGKEMVEFKRLSEVRVFEIIANEEDYK